MSIPGPGRARVWLAAAVGLALVVTACSPEAGRQRGGGPGADIGNHSAQLPQPAQAPAYGAADPGAREPQPLPGSPPGGIPPRP